MSITQKIFGNMPSGDQATLYTITNCNQHSVSIIDYGATIQSILMPDINGNLVDCCLGYNDFSSYLKYTDYLGALVGRVCGRIGLASFTLNGINYPLAVNNGINHLHGGVIGFSHRIFDVTIIDEQTLCFSLFSPDMEEGYPGNVTLKVFYQLSDDDTLTLDYQATTDQDTILNLTNHAYFNLSGENSGTVLQHELQIPASHYLINDENELATGEIASVEGTPFDFRIAKTIGKDIKVPHAQLINANGYDHNFCIDGEGMRTCGILYSPDTKIEMTIKTDLPGMQVYTGNFLSAAEGKGGHIYQPYDAVAMETQFYPNAMRQPHFPSIVIKAGEQYHKKTSYSFKCRE